MVDLTSLLAALGGLNPAQPQSSVQPGDFAPSDGKVPYNLNLGGLASGPVPYSLNMAPNSPPSSGLGALLANSSLPPSAVPPAASASIPPALAAQIFKPQYKGVGGFFQRLGDVLMEASGQKPIFEDQQKDDALRLAMQNLTGPNTLETINKVSSIDPQVGYTMYQNYLKNMRDQGEYDDKRGAASDKRDGVTIQRISDMVASATPDTWPQVAERAKAYAAMRGLSVSPDDIPATYDKSLVDRWARAAMNQKDSAMIDYRYANLGERTQYQGRMAGVAERNAATNEKNAGTNVQNAGSRAVIAGAVARNAGTNAQNAQTNIRNAGTNSRNADTRAADVANRAAASAARLRESVIARVVKANPGASLQVSPSTGKVRYSTDGGKTWIGAN